jgi:integrase
MATLTPTADGYRVRIRCGSVGQRYFTIALASEAAAQKRADALAAMAKDLVAAGKGAEAVVILNKGAAELDAARFREIEAFARELAARVETPKGSAPAPVTFRQLGEQWTSGELARRHPDHVRLKRSVYDDACRLTALYQSVGDVALKDFSLADAKRAMAALPEGRTSATRRHYAQLIARLLKMAVFPCELIERYPLPPGFLPKTGTRPALSYLYPAEDARLMACTLVPFELRLLYGFLIREGLRLGEALELRWRHVDIGNGTVRLERSKTGDVRAWALGADVARALAAVREARVEESADALVFPNAGGRPVKAFRAYLRTAGISRPELFERSSQRRPIRLHDQRAGFCTLALANGRTETWVMDRTGHATSQMLNKYRRQARHAAELALGWLAPLDCALPELDPTDENHCAPEQGASHEVSHDMNCETESRGISSGSKGTRTLDLRIKSPQLYRLSYRPRGRGHYLKPRGETTGLEPGRGAAPDVRPAQGATPSQAAAIRARALSARRAASG